MDECKAKTLLIQVRACVNVQRWWWMACDGCSGLIVPLLLVLSGEQLHFIARSCPDAMPSAQTPTDRPTGTHTNASFTLLGIAATNSRTAQVSFLEAILTLIVFSYLAHYCISCIIAYTYASPVSYPHRNFSSTSRLSRAFPTASPAGPSETEQPGKCSHFNMSEAKVCFAVLSTSTL